MKLIIAGSRNITLTQQALIRLVAALPFSQEITEIVSGGAPGIDSLAIKVFLNSDYKLTVMEAQWDLYGKSAGFIRNGQMASYADALLAIWDGKSPDTKQMIHLAESNGLKVKVYTMEDE